MNPRLVKFAVELQNPAKKDEKDQQSINFKNGGNKKFFNFLKPAKVSIPVNRLIITEIIHIYL